MIEPLTVNLFFIINPNFSMSYENEKTGLSCKNTEKSRLVRGTGFEPTHRNRHHPLKVACLPIPPPAHFKIVFTEEKSDQRRS